MSVFDDFVESARGEVDQLETVKKQVDDANALMEEVEQQQAEAWEAYDEAYSAAVSGELMTKDSLSKMGFEPLTAKERRVVNQLRKDRAAHQEEGEDSQGGDGYPTPYATA